MNLCLTSSCMSDKSLIRKQSHITDFAYEDKRMKIKGVVGIRTEVEHDKKCLIVLNSREYENVVAQQMQVQKNIATSQV